MACSIPQYIGGKISVLHRFREITQFSHDCKVEINVNPLELPSQDFDEENHPTLTVTFTDIGTESK